MIQSLQKAGFHIVRRKRGHVSLEKGAYRTVVPLHRELAKGTILGILKQCGLSREELESLMRDI